MTHSPHHAHGLAGINTAPQWPPLTDIEVAALLRHYPQLGATAEVLWHSPRPLSAACLVESGGETVFIKRHHQRVRSAATLSEEHRFMAHLSHAGVPVPAVLHDADGNTAVTIGEWTYEIHQRAVGQDIYRDAISWSPLPNRGHAVTAGRMLAELHRAANGYSAAQRGTHILVARSELLSAADPVAALLAQWPQRPGLASYLRQRNWQTDFHQLLLPWHAALQPQLAQQPRLWTHGDWHVSNLCWSGTDDDAAITSVLDFGLSAATFALFDLATAIERNAIAWLELDTGAAVVHIDIALALIEGYRQRLALSAADVHLLADLLPLVHLDFALSEVEYFYAITGSRADADVAYDTFLLGHAAWFGTPVGRSLLESIHGAT